MTNTTTSNATTTVHDLLDGWHAGIYTSGHVRDQLRKLDGNGTFSDKVQQQLNKEKPNGNGHTHSTTNGTPHNTKSSDTTTYTYEEVVALIKQASELLRDTIDNKIPCNIVANIIINTPWDYTDPTKVMRMEPDRAEHFMRTRAGNENNYEYFDDLSLAEQGSYKVYIFDAWKAWMRETYKGR